MSVHTPTAGDRTNAVQQKRRLHPSLDHFIGANEERLRDCQPKRLRSLEIDREIEFGRLLNGNIARFGVAQILVDILSGALEQRDIIWSVGQ